MHRQTQHARAEFIRAKKKKKRKVKQKQRTEKRKEEERRKGEGDEMKRRFMRAERRVKERKEEAGERGREVFYWPSAGGHNTGRTCRGREDHGWTRLKSCLTLD